MATGGSVSRAGQEGMSSPPSPQGPGVLSLCTICPLQSGRLCDPLAWRIAVAGGPESDEVTGRIGANRENAGTLPTTEAA